MCCNRWQPCLSRHHAPVSIEGHADAIPIRNPRHPSNWELSTSRAASVLRYLKDHGIAPERLHASGYAHTRPVAENNTEHGRATNRRAQRYCPTDERKTSPNPEQENPR